MTPKEQHTLDKIWNEAREASAGLNESIGFLRSMRAHNEISEDKYQALVQRLEATEISLRYIRAIA